MNCTADLWAGMTLGRTHHLSLDQSDLTRQVDVLLAALPPRFVLGGLSLGAIVAMAVAAAAPDRVAGLVVMSTNAKSPTSAQHDDWDDWIRRLSSGESARSLQAGIVQRLLSNRGRMQPQLVDRILAMGEQTGTRVLDAQLRLQHTRTDLRPGLKGLELPILVLSGRDDTICPPAFHEEIAATAPQSTLVSVEGGHLLSMEQPERVSALIRDWRSQNKI